jgi:acetyl-CoA acetyltransferase
MESPADPVILSAVRTPIGKRGGALASVHPAHLLGRVLVEGLARATAPAGEVEQGRALRLLDRPPNAAERQAVMPCEGRDLMVRRRGVILR